MKQFVLIMSLLTSASFAMAEPGTAAKGAPVPGGPDKVRMSPAERFAKLDTNRDGKVSKAEAATARGLAKHFDKVDANADGQLTQAEMVAAHEARGKMRMERRAAKFDAIDVDKNGAISRDEFVKHAPQKGHHHGKGGKGHHGGKGGRGGNGERGDKGERPGA